MNENTDSKIAKLALSLWTSDRAVEKLPVVRVYGPRETVRIVPQVSTLAPFGVWEGI